MLLCAIGLQLTSFIFLFNSLRDNQNQKTFIPLTTEEFTHSSSKQTVHTLNRQTQHKTSQRFSFKFRTTIVLSPSLLSVLIMAVIVNNKL